MQYIRVNLKSFYPDILKVDTFLSGVIYDDNFEYPNTPREAMLVLPGGGYEFISYREKDPVIFKFNSLGYNSFNLDYACKSVYPTPYLQLMCALHYLNTHSTKLKIKKGHISLVGFSAGGHLACTYATLFRTLKPKFSPSLIKPYALVLAYPTTSLIKSNSKMCKDNITHHDLKLMHLLSADEHIKKDYPPTFMWTTKTDEYVNPKNVIWLRDALNKQKIKNKCIIYPSGAHGLALANESTFCGHKKWLNKKVSKWPELAHQFIKSLKEK